MRQDLYRTVPYCTYTDETSLPVFTVSSLEVIVRASMPQVCTSPKPLFKFYVFCFIVCVTVSIYFLTQYFSAHLLWTCHLCGTLMCSADYISLFIILKNYFVIEMVLHNFNFHNIIVISIIMGEVISTVTIFIVITNEHPMHRASN